MSNPVVTDKWAGNFDCDFCRRKRLMGNEFSKTALTKYRKHGGRLKCKQCVQQAEENERKVAAEKRHAQGSTDQDPQNGEQQKEVEEDSTRECSNCKVIKPYSEYNRNQWNKGETKSRCRVCVEQSIQDETNQQTQLKESKLHQAKLNVEKAQQSGNVQAILKAESELSSLEAELVTGLKPIKLSSSGRGGRGRGGGRGRSTTRGGGRGGNSRGGGGGRGGNRGGGRGRGSGGG